MTASVAPLATPSAGSASPATSLPSLWSYLSPALDHIVRSPTDDNGKAPPISVEWHMGIHTATYNYFTTQSESATTGHGLAAVQRDNGKAATISGSDLYEQLDKYYSDTARELLLDAPEDHTTLIQYLIPCFNRYNAGAASINRLLNYVNRHYVKRAVDEDKGWLRLNDVLDAVARNIKGDDTREKIAKKLKERRTVELKAWGYANGGSPELMAQAESCAEAASTLDRIVPLSSLALRRFRTELLEPLLKAPKINGKGKKKRPPPGGGDMGSLPKGRLARAVKELLETSAGGEDEKRRIAAELADMMKVCGVQADQPLRKKLEKYVIATASI